MLSVCVSEIPGSIINQCILQKSTEHEEDTDTRPHVYSLGVGNWGEGVLDAGLGGGHG